MGALASGRWPGSLGLAELPTAQADLREEAGGGFPRWAVGPSGGHQLLVPPASAPLHPPSLVLAPEKSREGLCLGPLCPS